MDFDGYKNLPEEFVTNVLNTCGDRGREWLDDLPRIVSDLEAGWQIKSKSHFADLSFNFVCPCELPDGTPAVLKIGLPINDDETASEVAALKALGGSIVKIYRDDPGVRAILIERVYPGKNLKEVFSADPDRAVATGIREMKNTFNAESGAYEFQSLDVWFDELRAAIDTRFPQEYVTAALSFYENHSGGNRFLLHGDLHHENILSSSDGTFRVIDPKGIIGNIGYEIAVFLNNHATWVRDRESVESAVGEFSKAFDVPKNELKSWAFAQQVLGVWWDYDGGGRMWEERLKVCDYWRSNN